MIKIENNNCGVYGIFTSNNYALYVGCSIDINRRYKEHLTGFIMKNHPNDELLKCLKYYDINSLVFKTLTLCSKDDLFYYESIFIKLFNPIGNRLKIDKSNSDLKINFNLIHPDYEVILNFINKNPLEDKVKTSDICQGIYNETNKVISYKKVAKILILKGYKSKRFSKEYGGRIYYI